MADSPSLPPPPEIKQEIKTDSENQTDPSSSTPPPPPPLTPLQSSSPSTSSSSSSFTHVLETPNTTNQSVLTLQPPPSLPPPPLIQSYQPNAGTIPPPGLQFRPIPQFSSVPNPNMQNPNFQNHNIQNPNVLPSGVNPGGGGAAGAVSVSVSPLRPPGMYHGPPYQQMPNGYSTMPPGSIPPPGMLRYPNPYASMVRPPFPLPPGPMGMLPLLSRPPIPGIRGVPPIIQPVVRPVVPIVAPTEKPQTTVYVGKIASTVENDFMLSLLRLCGPVKSWKRAPESSDGTPRSFGFCEFESAEGVLRALRLLTKINVDRQELVLNVNKKTREYLERYVEKKTEREKLKETETDGTENEEVTAPGVEKKEPSKPTLEDPKKDVDDSADNEKRDTTQNFGVVTDEDREADRDVMDKLKNMIEERLKTKPLPPSPALTSVDASGKSNTEVPTKSRDVESDIDIMKTDVAEDKNDDEMTSENKTTSEHDRAETSSPDKNRRHDRKSRERDRERDLKREKERELERYERERERERVRKERERDLKIREADRLYKERVKEWESAERDREYQRQSEREREKEREREHKREINDQEDESDDDSSRKRRRRSSMVEDKRKKRLREKEEDMADRIREEEEIAEARRRAIEERQRKNEPENVPDQVNGGTEDVVMEDSAVEDREDAVEKENEIDSVTGNRTDDVVMTNGNSGDDLSMLSVSTSDNKQGNVPAWKLGFSPVRSGKRTTVPSVFHEEDDVEANKDKKMRPLVPIDYSTEELQAVQPTAAPGEAPPNLAAAAEFAKRISSVNPKEERYEVERDRNRRSGDRLSHRERDRDRNDGESNHVRDETRDKTHDRDREREHGLNKLKTPENKKLLDAKQLIDMIPKTKEELFAYDINWDVYEKHELHERMRPWISKKITEFLGEEETTLVDYIVSSTKGHVRASHMLELLQSILDDEAEMFVLKMWRMLIFEIKKVETGLSSKTKA